MTTWTTIPNANLDPDAPARSVDALALRDNPIAIAEGATGAPKVRTAALQKPAAGSTLIALISGIGGTEVVATGVTAYPSTGLGKSYDDASHIGFMALFDGTVSLSVDHRLSSAGATAYVRVIKNGVQVTEWSTTSTTFTTRTVDVAVAAGDIVVFQQRSTDGSRASGWKNLTVSSATPDFAVA